MNKKAATVVQWVLLIAVLVISLIVVGSLKNIFFWQAKNVEIDTATALLDKIILEVERAQSYVQKTSYDIDLPFSAAYEANISRGTIKVKFIDSGTEVTRPLIVPNVNVLPSLFSSSGKIFVYKTGNNLLITNNLTCDPADSVCDIGCIAIGKCDPQCYVDNTYDSVCNPYCLDRNGDGVTDGKDTDTICDPDCYNADKQGFFYDPDCVRNQDNLCDPDSHNSADGLCDRECLGTNGVCDLDCQEFDADCSHKNNGRCEPELGETCLYFPNDCPCDPGSTCKLGCPFFSWPDEFSDPQRGCVDNSLVGFETNTVESTCQCNGTLIMDHTGRCCEPGEYWQGGVCKPYYKDGLCNLPQSFNSSFPKETCRNSPDDCPCPIGTVCCPNAPNAPSDAAGCAPIQYSTGMASLCGCPGQCDSGKCSNGHCCDLGYEWVPNGGPDGNGACELDCSDCRTTDLFALCDNPADGPVCDCNNYHGDDGEACPAGQSCCPGSDGVAACVPGSDRMSGDTCDCANQCGADPNYPNTVGGTCSEGHCCPIEDRDNGNQIEWVWVNGACERYAVYYSGDFVPTQISGEYCSSPIRVDGCRNSVGNDVCSNPDGDWATRLYNCMRGHYPSIARGPHILVGSNTTGPCDPGYGNDPRNDGVFTEDGRGFYGQIYAETQAALNRGWGWLRDRDYEFSCN